MKKIFKITSPGFLPIRISVETDDKKAIRTITEKIETWLAKLTKELFPESYGTWEELSCTEEPYTDDATTIKDIGGSLDSFPTPTDDTTDSSGTWMGLTARHWLVTSGNFIL